jgi:hypothetical protein
MKKIIYVLIALVSLSAMSYGQITVLHWRDSSTIMVPVKAEPVKAAKFLTPTMILDANPTSGTARLTLSGTAGIKGGNIFVDTANVAKIFGSYCGSDVSNGTPRFTVGTAIGTGSGQTYLDTIYIGTSLLIDHNKYISGSSIIADKSNGTARVTVGTSAGTGAGNFWADSCHLGLTTLAGKATADSLRINGRGMVNMNAVVSQFAIKAGNDVGFALGLYRYGSTTPVAQIDTNGFLKASTVTRGTKTFTYATKVDTNTSAVGVRAGDIVIVTPVVNTASDTTSIRNLWIQKISSDTIFVIQTTSGTVTKPSYNWFVLK